MLYQFNRYCRDTGITIGTDYLFTLNVADDQVEFMIIAHIKNMERKSTPNKPEFLVTNSDDKYIISKMKELIINQVGIFKYLGIL